MVRHHLWSKKQQKAGRIAVTWQKK